MIYDYDVAVIGGGAAGLTAAGLAANLAARTLLVEARRLGGDCTWYGCVPSKTLIKGARVAYQMRNAGHYGLIDQEPTVDFAGLMGHVRRTREGVYEDADKPEHFERMGVEVRQGKARFVDAHTLEVSNSNKVETVTARYVLIATGSSPLVPDVEGIRTIDYLTNETLFELNELPRRFAVIGGGPIGIEMAQAFERFGAEVVVLQSQDRILPRDDPELSGLLKARLEREGITVLLNARVNRLSRGSEHGEIQIEADAGGAARTLFVDAVLVAAGRKANVEGLNLEAAGVEYDPRGIRITDRCRTNVGHIYAVGDGAGRFQFTHYAEHMAKVAVTNALLKLPLSIDTRHVPWCTFADPELAHVGASETELQERGVRYEVYRFPFSKIDRAITENETAGLIKVFAKKWSGKILGTSIVGSQAGEMISEYALAMRNGVSLRKISDTIHPYPTYGLGNRRAADQWYVRSQSLPLIRAIRSLFGYRGVLPQPFDPARVV
jgi:pyruvate/2-oxoglutarate dehydrogenase complex dihydrolipoamide dehydrogenase (E3) component